MLSIAIETVLPAELFVMPVTVPVVAVLVTLGRSRVKFVLFSTSLIVVL